MFSWRANTKEGTNEQSRHAVYFCNTKTTSFPAITEFHKDGSGFQIKLLFF